MNTFPHYFPAVNSPIDSKEESDGKPTCMLFLTLISLSILVVGVSLLYIKYM